MKRQQNPIAITLAPSYTLVFLYGLLALFTSACLLFLPISFVWIVICCGLVCLGCVYAVLGHALLLLPSSWVCLTLNAKPQWHAKNKRGDVLEVTISPDTLVTPFLTIVNIQNRHKKSLGRFLLLPSRGDAESFRQLRVVLLWGNNHDQGLADSVDALEKSN